MPALVQRRRALEGAVEPGALVFAGDDFAGTGPVAFDRLEELAILVGACASHGRNGDARQGNVSKAAERVQVSSRTFTLGQAASLLSDHDQEWLMLRHRFCGSRHRRA